MIFIPLTKQKYFSQVRFLDEHSTLVYRCKINVWSLKEEMKWKKVVKDRMKVRKCFIFLMNLIVCQLEKFELFSFVYFYKLKLFQNKIETILVSKNQLSSISFECFNLAGYYPLSARSLTLKKGDKKMIKNFWLWR